MFPTASAETNLTRELGQEYTQIEAHLPALSTPPPAYPFPQTVRRARASKCPAPLRRRARSGPRARWVCGCRCPLGCPCRVERDGMGWLVGHGWMRWSDYKLLSRLMVAMGWIMGELWRWGAWGLAVVCRSLSIVHPRAQRKV